MIGIFVNKFSEKLFWFMYWKLFGIFGKFFKNEILLKIHFQIMEYFCKIFVKKCLRTFKFYWKKLTNFQKFLKSAHGKFESFLEKNVEILKILKIYRKYRNSERL